MAVDVRRVDDADIVEAGDLGEPRQSLRGKTPVDELVARMDLARPVDLDRRDVARQPRP